MDTPKWEQVVTNLSVPAKTPGLWTLVVPYIAPGVIVQIMATGTWNYADAASACGPDGARTPVGGIAQANCLNANALVRSLVGKLGGGPADKAGTIFGVGSQTALKSPAEGGALFLAINDQVDGADNNSGSLTVQVFVADLPAAPPAPTASAH